MGPSCGLALADLGADVIKIEPAAEGSKPAGDNTRRLRGAGAGFFAMLNRNKRSLVLDLKQEQGRQAARALAAEADVLIENFRPGALDRQGLGYEALRQVNPRLVYCSLKGFLPGPYEHRVALDEVVQMMGGLAYMTGPEGRPLRAGASVNDIMGGMFGAIGAMAALAQRERTGQGQEVQSALFENNVFLVAQHMMQYAVTGKAPSPMPSRIAAWGVYDVFTVAGGEQVFLAVVSDTQWAIFCDAFGFDDLKNDPRLDSNNKRVMERAWMMPLLRERLGTRRAAEISAIFEARGLPFAPIARPEDLFDDPHLNETGGLAPMHLPDGRDTKVPLMPIALDGVRPGVRNDPPRLGEHTRGLLRELGYADADIDALCSREVVAG
jgi:crotonobetainyl-CoA:carnitine CoA-transferase CaiB-like acyl-CoA transferase